MEKSARVIFGLCTGGRCREIDVMLPAFEHDVIGAIILPYGHLVSKSAVVYEMVDQFFHNRDNIVTLCIYHCLRI